MSARSPFTVVDHPPAGPEYKTRRWKTLAGRIVCALLITLVWGLLSLPVVFEFLPGEAVSHINSGKNECSPEVYSGGICLSVLQDLLQATVMSGDGNATTVYIATRGVDQIQSEQLLKMMTSMMLQSDSTQECVDAFLPFMCQYLLPVCDKTSGDLLLPSQEECLTISTGVCRAKWELAAQFIDAAVGDYYWPSCDDLPTQGTSIINYSNISVPVFEAHNSSSNITCGEGFFLENGSCFPECGALDISSSREFLYSSLVMNSLTVVMATIFLLAAVIKGKSMFSVPSVFVVYSVLLFDFIAILRVISSAGSTTLLCHSANLLETFLDGSTLFCSIGGIMELSFFTSITMFTVFHVLFMYVGVVFPFKKKYIDSSGYSKYIHLTVVLLSLLVPIGPAVSAEFLGGFTINSSPPSLCLPRNTLSWFLALALPVTVFLGLAVSLLILLIYKITKYRRERNSHSLNTAENKLMVVFIYFFLVAIVFVVASTTTTSVYAGFREDIFLYFLCESTGLMEGKVCEQSSLFAIHFCFALIYVMEALYPMLCLIYIIKFQELKECFISHHGKLQHSAAGPQRKTQASFSNSHELLNRNQT